MNGSSQSLPEEKSDEASAPISDAPAATVPAETLAISGDHKHESAPVRYTQQQQKALVPCDSSLQSEDEQRKKTAAAEVAAKLTASTSSAQMLSYVLSSLASESIIGNQSKRPKVENGLPLYLPTPAPAPAPAPAPLQSQPPPPPPPFPHPDSVIPPPPPSPPPTMPLMMPPLMPPANVSQFVRAGGPMVGVIPYNYGSSPLQISPSLSLPAYSIPANPYQGFQMPDGVGTFNLQPLPPTPLPPLSRQ